jgi:hypothetical protein
MKLSDKLRLMLGLLRSRFCEEESLVLKEDAPGEAVPPADLPSYDF